MRVIRLLTEGGILLLAMQRYAPICSRDMSCKDLIYAKKNTRYVLQKSHICVICPAKVFFICTQCKEYAQQFQYVMREDTHGYSHKHNTQVLQHNRQ